MPTDSPFDAHKIGVEAYIYLYPLVTMELTRRQMTNSAPGAVPARGPMNTFAHVRQFPDAELRAVVRVNFDTLYSIAWLDLSAGPIVVSVPDSGGRYYLLPMYDMWTDSFASPGWRTSGTGAASWAVVPPGWSGELPVGVREIQAPTPTVWIIGRTQSAGASDYAEVHKFQDGLSLTPLATWPNASEPAPFVPDPTIDNKTEPSRQVNSLSAVEFFTLAAELLKQHPPHATDFSVLERISRIGITPGESFDAKALDADTLAGLQTVPAEALAHLQALMPTMARVVNGWVMNTDSMGVYGNFYVKRAIVTMVGLGANQVEDAFYPLQVATSDGQPADGSKKYVLHFAADQLPPVDAFWSVTLYDGEGFQVANELNRFAIGDRSGMTFNADGSLDIHVQHENPGPALESNWLPAPSDAFSLCMRLYAPHPEAMDGRWAPPALTVV